MEIFELSNTAFAEYLDRLADDFACVAGKEPIAEDYREAARRIREIPNLEQAAFEGGMVWALEAPEAAVKNYRRGIFND